MTNYRVKYYSKYDWAGGHMLRKSEDVIQSFNCLDKENLNVNQIIELYNIQLYFKNGCTLPEWDNEKTTEYSKKADEFTQYIARFYSTINDENIINHYNMVENDYKNHFWYLFNHYKTYKRISISIIKEMLIIHKKMIRYLLLNKDIVKQYSEMICEYIEQNSFCAEYIMDKYLVRNEQDNKCYFFPNELNKEIVLNNYLDSDDPNPNYVGLLANSLSVDGLILSDKLRLKAIKKHKQLIENLFLNNPGIKYGVNIQFINNHNKPVEITMKDGILTYVYDSPSIIANQDYEIILLYNFIYLFGYVDSQIRITHVSNSKNLSLIESLLGINGIREYKTGIVFNQFQMSAQMQMIGYYNLLESELDLRLETVCDWYFNEYISKEFGANGFIVNLPTAQSSYLEKCRTIISEIDSILKQYSLFVENGKIDHELLQISSEHLFFEHIPSLLVNKYLYPIGEEFKKASFLLCSDQSMLSYLENISTTYDNLYLLLQNENIKISNYEDYQIHDINWLISKGYIAVNTEGYLKNNQPFVSLIKDAYENQVISYYHNLEYQEAIKELVERNVFEFKSTLFSKLECDYFNYLLNRKEFHNGLDLRNRYIHGTQSIDKKQQKQDYYVFLRILILCILKINDELCLTYDVSEGIIKIK